MASESVGASSFSVVVNTTKESSISPARKSRKSPNFSLSEQVFVTILVGADLQKFVIHKRAICHYSSFFQTAFDVNSAFIEGQTQEMKLEDVDADLFGILVNWCYTQKIEHMERDITLLDLGKLWTLGDRFFMPKLQNCAMSAIAAGRKNLKGDSDETRYKPYQEFMEYAYCTPGQGTLLKRASMKRCLAIIAGGNGMAAAGKGGDFVDFFFGEGPAQDLLKELLQHFKTEISARVPNRSTMGPLYVPENI